MPLAHAEAGKPGSLRGLPLKDLNVRGNGFFDIREHSSRPQMSWRRRDQSNDHPTAFRRPERVASGVLDGYSVRIEYLKEMAAQDGYELSDDSKADFGRFIGSKAGLRVGNLVLMENGNLRASWKDERGSHLGLQFLGDGMVQYVVFKRREVGPETSRVAGRDTVDGIWRQISAFDLGNLIIE